MLEHVLLLSSFFHLLTVALFCLRPASCVSHIMAELPAKQRRIVELRSKLPYVSHTAFAAWCHLAQTEAIPIASRNSVRKARDAIACQETPFGPLIKTVKVVDVDGELVDFSVTCPIATLWAAAQKHWFGILLKRTFFRQPPSPVSPWHL